MLVAENWRAMVGRAVVGSDDPDTIAPLLEAYLQRFPKAARLLDTTTNGSGEDHEVVVWCRPRWPAAPVDQESTRLPTTPRPFSRWGRCGSG